MKHLYNVGRKHMKRVRGLRVRWNDEYDRAWMGEQGHRVQKEKENEKTRKRKG